MIVLGIAALFFTEDIKSLILKIIGEKRGLFDLNRRSINIINSSQTKWSMKFGGIIALLMGLFFLWAIWRSLRQ